MLNVPPDPPIRVEPDLWRIVSTVSSAATTLLLMVLVVILWRSNANLRRRFHRIADDAERLQETAEQRDRDDP